ncbi:MAG TPA: helix-turn-helix domain-containing protein [Terracidiphilus sp.]|nr:helix-turn-helix domain-containing protein [Terracidiphilus sp.]
MGRKTAEKRRSGCPVSVSLEMLGDRWSLLIVRDMMVRGYRTFGEFQHSGEGIATNILSERLRRLEAAGLVDAEPAAEDGRSIHYRLTEKGIALAPVLLELLIWAARHEETDAPKEVIDQMEANRAWVLAETRRRWEEHDPTPLLPPFRSTQTPVRKAKQAARSSR